MSAADDMLDRPAMPVAPRSMAAPRAQPRITFGALPDDVVALLRGWGDGASATAIVIAMTRALAEPRHAVLRAQVLSDAAEIARDRRARRWRGRGDTSSQRNH
jgi:hypothetical protein